MTYWMRRSLTARWTSPAAMKTLTYRRLTVRKAARLAARPAAITSARSQVTSRVLAAARQNTIAASGSAALERSSLMKSDGDGNMMVLLQKNLAEMVQCWG